MRGSRLGTCVLGLLLAACGESGTQSLEGEPRDPYRLQLTLNPATPRAGEVTNLRFTLRRARDGAPVTDLQIVHERALHTFIVAADFSSFSHLHHEDFRPLAARDIAAAAFAFPYRFPAGGRFRVYNEFTHRDRTWLKHFTFDVQGPAPSAPPRTPGLRAHAGGIDGRLDLSPAVPVAGHEVEMVLTLRRGAAPVQDLRLWLGAEVHAAIWRADGAHFGHTHSYTTAMAKMARDMAGHGKGHSAAMMLQMMSAPAVLEYPGPRIPIRHTFPTDGRYHLFLQCAPGGEPRVFHFLLDVAADTAGRDTRIESIVPDA